MGRARIVWLGALMLALVVAPPAQAREAERPEPAAKRSIVQEALFDSAALGRRMPYLAYLPPGYEGSTERYPVLYMLHGLGGGRGDWRALGLLDAADRMIRAREIAPLVIVMPQGDAGYWMDHAGSDSERWGTYTARDLVRDVDARFRTLPERSHRAIGGLSMGAHGALQLALNNPDTFSAAGGHSLVLRRLDQAFPFFGALSDYVKRDPLSIVAGDPDGATRISLWVDIGDRDPWLPRTREFERTLDRFDVDHEWHLWPGDHSGDYWAAHVPDYLRFYDRALRGSAAHGRRAPARFPALVP